MEKQIQEYCREVFAEAVRIRREIHAHPEPGMECYETAERVKRELDRIGIPCRVIDRIGVVGEIRGTAGESDKVVMLRADMDSLSVPEKTGLPYASEYEGKMHACGHDIHSAMLLGTAEVLMKIRDRFAGTVRLVFQPGEEISMGALYLIERGVLEGVGMGFGMHVEPLAPVGRLLCRRGPDWAAVDHFYITVHGTGAHGATPQDGADATVAAAAIVMNLQTMVSRECNPMKPLVVTTGMMHSGHGFNVISDEATLEGTCRSFDDEVYDMLPEVMERIAKRTAEAFGCTADVRFDRLAKAVINDDHAYDVLKGAADKVLADKADWLEAKQAMIGEDFAEYAYRVPCVFAHLGVDGGYPLHSSYVNFKEEGMLTGMAVEVQFALDALADLNKK